MYLDTNKDYSYIEIVIGGVIFYGYGKLSEIGSHNMSDAYLIKHYRFINNGILDNYILKRKYSMRIERSMKGYIELLRDKVRG